MALIAYCRPGGNRANSIASRSTTSCRALSAVAGRVQYPTGWSAYWHSLGHGPWPCEEHKSRHANAPPAKQPFGAPVGPPPQPRARHNVEAHHQPTQVLLRAARPWQRNSTRMLALQELDDVVQRDVHHHTQGGLVVRLALHLRSAGGLPAGLQAYSACVRSKVSTSFPTK